MIELGIILLILGTLVVIVCNFTTVPVGVRIGLGVAVLGGVLILLGLLLPLVPDGLGHDDVDNNGAVVSTVL